MTLAEFVNTSQAWTLVFMAILGIAQGLIAWALWSLRKVFVTTQACADCREKCRLEVDAAAEEQKTSANALHDKIVNATPREEAAELGKEVAVVRETINTLRATVDGLQELLVRAERQLGLLMEHHIGGSRR